MIDARTTMVHCAALGLLASAVVCDDRSAGSAEPAAIDPKAGEADEQADAAALPPPAAPADKGELKATAMAGPFASVAKVCTDARKLAPDPKEKCTVPGPPEFPPTAELAAPFTAFEFREVADPGRGALDEAACVVALKTSKGWFHHTWHCEHIDEEGEYATRFDSAKVEDLVPGDSPELLIVLTYTRTEDGTAAEEQHVLVCGVGPSGIPACLAPIPRDGRVGEADREWKLEIVSAPGGLEIKNTATPPVAGTESEAIVSSPGRYRVAFP
jgi:hypothetical protein